MQIINSSRINLIKAIYINLISKNQNIRNLIYSIFKIIYYL